MTLLPSFAWCWESICSYYILLAKALVSISYFYLLRLCLGPNLTIKICFWFALHALLLHAECHLLLCYSFMGNSCSPITCSSDDPLLRTLSITVVRSIIAMSATLCLGSLLFYVIFAINFLFFPWFVAFGKLILCSIYALHLGCELWALLISWLKTVVVV